MNPVLINFSKAIGYDNPEHLCRQSLWAAAACGVATVSAKFFVPELKLESELFFSTTSSVTFILLWQNRKIERVKKAMAEGDPLRKDIMNILFFLIFTMIPVLAARSVHNRLLSKRLSYSQSFTRGIYNGTLSLTILYAYGAFQRQKQILPGS